ncbi:MarR family winged helix-turn-helix transcriptional regulator [Flavilitoribacter nigricans]|uniref:MarR family transcriptional regulator n=1 Tax=Flavilitoribacter nigricans (strain ATCC 23147 / DSM 23189 / NBRC 102662 / NCIMB 1420 / SS-2) TaxID=1122177 RepID=A0A2D0NHK3_FLAN2|nr:MarR family transcriptional regulator [Flavilitoribacter nigricans]PHN07975.1 MarR family transcriptional regulator [Flavilitoribacter nigricans DSM 23189 = NBRC 102662]
MGDSAHSDSTEHFRAISRAYSDASILMHEAIARKAGLTGTDHKYLGLIINKGPCTAGEIAGMTGLTTGAVTGLIDRLEKKKLVKRQADKRDRRKVMVVPDVRKTMALLEPVFADLQEQTAALLATFSREEIEIIERYFLGATDIMRAVSANLNT